MSYVSESSWETAFSGDEFATGFATWFETESGDNELVLSGYDVWNETDSLNSVLQSEKFVHFPPGQYSLRETAGNETDLWSTCWRVARQSLLCIFPVLFVQ